MKQKFLVIIIMLLTISASIIVPYNIKIKASTNYGDPDINHDYIYEKIDSLSDIIEDVDYQPMGRFFGEDGEQKAADDIEDWMDNIGLDTVHQEKIDATWKPLDQANTYYKGFTEALYIGPLDLFRILQDYYVNISIYWSSNDSLKEYKNLSYGECFPYYPIPKLGQMEKDFKGEAYVYEDFDFWNLRQTIELCDIHWLNHWNYIGQSPVEDIIRPFYVGVIGIDNNTETHGQIPPIYDHRSLLRFGVKPAYFVNQTIGNWIRNALNDEDDFYVKANYRTYWKRETVTSNNVIGHINGSDPDPKIISIIGAHYDSMWNGGTIDEAAGVALVLGIAKLIKDRELESKLKHKVKFIAFGGEEVGIRGACDYIKTHVKKLCGGEKVQYMINPGNFGHYNRSGTDFFNNPYKVEGLINFTFYSYNTSLNNLTENITNALEYTPRTYIAGEENILLGKISDWMPAEDSKIFSLKGKNYAKNCIEIDRFPYWQYHRDGVDHTKGDNLDCLDNLTYHLECEAITSLTLHLLLNHSFSFVNCSNSTFDLDNDGDIDSVIVHFNITSDTNVSLFGNVTGCLYNSSTGDPVSYINSTGLIPIIKGNNTYGYLNLTLFPNITYDNYTAKLVLKDVFGNTHDECNETVSLEPYGEPLADFSWQVGVPPPKKIMFTDESFPSFDETISTWNWSFGDDNYSTSQNPNHTYENAGIYNVNLTIMDSGNLYSNISKRVTVFNLCASVSFKKSKQVEKIGDPIKFESTSTDDGSITNTKWYFGDGTTGNGRIINHSYSDGGIYTITLEITDNDGAISTITDTILIANEYADDSFSRNDSSEGNWTTIQAAINNASDDDFIYVFNGTYNNITVDKEVALYGANNVIISTQQTAVDIVCNNVSFNSFTIENAATGIKLNRIKNVTITNCSIQNSTTGIKLENGADSNIISDCNMINNTYGVFIRESDNNIIGSPTTLLNHIMDNCIFEQNTYGLYLLNSDNNFIFGCTINASNSNPLQMVSTNGIYLDNSEGNTILLCDIFKSNNYGIYFSGSHENSVEFSVVRENSKGIYLSGSSDNDVIANNISDNSQSGVNILTMTSSDNSICFNDFIDNGGVLYPQASDSGTNNIWNSSENITFIYNASGEGNNWSDYTGSDSDGDGIGNTAYSIAGTANAEDSYPVMEAYGWTNKWS